MHGGVLKRDKTSITITTKRLAVGRNEWSKCAGRQSDLCVKDENKVG